MHQLFYSFANRKTVDQIKDYTVLWGQHKPTQWSKMWLFPSILISCWLRCQMFWDFKHLDILQIAAWVIEAYAGVCTCACVCVCACVCACVSWKGAPLSIPASKSKNIESENSRKGFCLKSGKAGFKFTHRFSSLWPQLDYQMWCLCFFIYRRGIRVPILGLSESAFNKESN